MDSDHIIRTIWEERINSQYIYRGMSVMDLKDPLDPGDNPHKDVLPQLYEFLTILEKIVNAGFLFKVIERHGNMTYEHDLRDIIVWTRRDLSNASIDFTSSYRAAGEYADCWQGSQLKQNLKYITDHLLQKRDHTILNTIMTDDAWTLFGEIVQWVSYESPDHKGIVLWISRTSSVFDSNRKCLLLGSFESFKNNILTEMEKMDFEINRQTVQKILPSGSEEFYFRLTEPLSLKAVDKIDVQT